jgi:8-oxo-dGTP pyrophosphatase MutT (NUDIX family)
MPPPQVLQDGHPPALEHDPSLEAFNIPVQDWLAANPLHQLIVSAVVSLPSSFPSLNQPPHHQAKTNHHQPAQTETDPQHSEEDSSKEEERTLLLQRAPHDWDPLTWEHPGGTCEPDETVLQAVARELAEETGLVARRVVGLVTQLDIAEPGFDDEKEKRGVRPWWRLFCFLVEVEVGVDGGVPPVVRLDPAEHCAFVWATEGDVRRGMCGDVEMRWGGEEDKRKGVILRGFEVLRERRALENGRGL